MKVTGMNRTTEQRNLLRIYSIDKKENGICLQICSNKTEEKIEESQKKGDSDMAEFDYEVVNGRKIRVRPQEVVSEIDENGYFVRQPNHFTEGFGEGKNPVEKGRYHLVWAKLCHWSNRASIVRELLGLEDAISVNMVDHAKHEKNLGWEFVYDKEHIDPVLGIQFLSEAYYKADDDYTGRTTVPALIDTKTGKVVNNDYTWLTNYFEVDFKPFHKKGAPDLYPEELRKDIDEMNDWLFDNINNGVYKDINNLSSDEWKSYMVGVSLSSNLMTKIRGLNEYDEEYFKNISGNIVSDNTIASSFYLTKEERDSIAKTESKEINDFLLGQDGGSIDRYVISLEDAKNAVTKKFKDLGTLFDESFIYKSSGFTYVYIKSLNKIYGIVGSTIRTPILITQTKKTDYLYTVWFSKCHLKDECINEYENNKLEVYEVTFKKHNGNYIFDSIKIV